MINQDQEKEELKDEDECQILDFMGISNTPNLFSQTLKLQGELQGILIQVLVDIGASHNFISRKLVSKLGLSTRCSLGLTITLGDGHQLWVKERCHGMVLNLGIFSCMLNALVFDLGNLDMVLGMEWLKTLGEVLHNWKEHSMRFKHDHR